MEKIILLMPVAVLAALCLWKVQLVGERNCTELVQSNLNSLRGLFALVIVLGHATQIFQFVPGVLAPFSKINTLCVGFFFAMSGYGLAYSLHKKNNYRKTFLLPKLFYLFLHALTAVSVSTFISYIESLILHTPIWNTGVNWYLIMAGVFYIIFYLIVNNVKTDKNICCFSWIVVILISVFAMLIKLPRVYYISEWCFPMGITVFYYKDKISFILKEYLGKCIFVIISVFIVSLLSFVVKDYTFLDILMHNMLCISFYFLVFIILSFVKVKNRLLELCTKISMEIYLYQFIVFAVLNDCYKCFEITYWSWHYVTSIILIIALSSCMYVLTRHYKVLSQVICDKIHYNYMF